MAPKGGTFVQNHEDRIRLTNTGASPEMVDYIMTYHRDVRHKISAAIHNGEISVDENEIKAKIKEILESKK